MPTPRRPHMLLKGWLESLPVWSRRMNADQMRELAQGLADLHLQLTSTLHIDPQAFSGIADYVDGRLRPRRLTRQARAHLAQMIAICRQPWDFVSVERLELMEADFSDAYGAALELREHIVSRMGLSAWSLFGALRQLPADVAPIANGDITKIAIAVDEMYLRVIQALGVQKALLQPISGPRDYAAGWKTPFPIETCRQVIRLMELCKHPARYIPSDLRTPVDRAEQLFREEAINLVVFLAELKAVRA